MTQQTGTLRERATIDVVIIILAVVVAAVITISIIGIVALSLLQPAQDTRAYLNLIDAQVSVIVGALVGLIAGQASARAGARTTTTEQHAPAGDAETGGSTLP